MTDDASRDESDVDTVMGDALDGDAEPLTVAATDAARAGDLLWLDAVLRQWGEGGKRKAESGREAALRLLRANLDREIAASLSPAAPVAASSSAGRRIARRSGWSAAAIAVAFFSVRFFLEVGFPPDVEAATVTIERSLTATQRDVDREYAVTGEFALPTGRTRTVASTLFVRGGSRLALRHPALLADGDVWLGWNGRQGWLVPAIGPVIVADDFALLDEPAAPGRPRTPFLQLTRILERLRDRYELTSRGRESLAKSHDERPTKDKMCRVVEGRLLTDDPLWPQRIELWTDPSNGIVKRLRLDWSRPAGSVGRPQSVTFELVAERSLPDDWYEHASHHAADRITIALPKR